ncbi:MAG: 50S ribosomal protein L30 [Christensenellales bacterium]
MLRVTLVKSPIGFSKDQRRTVTALGLNKLNSSNELPDNNAVRGMIFKIKHLVRVDEV